MRAVLLLLSAGAFCAVAQVSAPIGIIRGDLIDWQADHNTGDLNVRSVGEQNASKPVYRCHFDGFTYMEREGQRISVGALQPGERLEMITDHKPGSEACYARTIRVISKNQEVVNPGHRVYLNRSRTSTLDYIYPRGNLLFSAVVIRLNPTVMVVRTRRDGEKVVLLRQDTRYMDSGLPVDRSNLMVNTRVSIRGGRNLDNDLEAYQVIWGEISGPK